MFGFLWVVGGIVALCVCDVRPIFCGLREECVWFGKVAQVCERVICVDVFHNE